MASVLLPPVTPAGLPGAVLRVPARGAGTRPCCGNPFTEMKDGAEAEPGLGALQDGNWFPC